MDFLPDDFKVPERLETDKFRLRKLTMADVEKDYEAVMSSVEHLKSIFGPTEDWPVEDMTLEEHLEDLRMHQGEFQFRKSFAYTVMNLDESQCLGGVYFFPPYYYLNTNKEQYDVVVFTWVRGSELPTNLDEELFNTIKKWIREKWPFKKPVYPGRETDWKDLDYRTE
ncbi:MAG: GNAT family N-acetyltransferase [Promethearchaeota archaeon]